MKMILAKTAQKIVLSIVLLAAISASAAERSVPYLNDTIYTDTDAKNLDLASIAVRKVTSKVRDLDPCRSPSPDSDLEICEETIEKTEVVQLSFRYEEGDRSVDDNSYEKDINLPLSSFSAEEVAQIRKLNKGIFDIGGKKAKARRSLANQLVGYTTERVSYMKDIMECVETNGPDSDLCVKWVKVGEKEVFMNKLQFSRK